MTTDVVSTDPRQWWAGEDPSDVEVVEQWSGYIRLRNKGPFTIPEEILQEIEEERMKYAEKVCWFGMEIFLPTLIIVLMVGIFAVIFLFIRALLIHGLD